jgi:hypothetical protein
MQVTRNSHYSYLTWLTPVLGLAYIIQSYLVLKFWPTDFTRDVLTAMGICLMGSILVFFIYDKLHVIKLHPKYIEVSWPLFQMHEEYLYQNVIRVDVKKGFFSSFADVEFEMLNGEVVRLRHVDNGEEIKRILLRNDHQIATN